ncbi:MAG: GntR family transcriptional regulator [Defluviitaleaceae bacterium]|nr:GntR family transcriptional regulator [Defluviitaleaceae bacterium]
MMSEFDNNQPIYQQIVEQIRLSIAKGELSPGAKVASVRDMALRFRVNPNTMQKSLAKLEDMGYLHSERTSGRFVTDDLALIETLKAEIPSKITGKYVSDMTEFGIAAGDIPNFVRTYIERGGPYGQRTGN